ncbi:hypothetical protein ACFQ7N_39920 [Streptomyces niveus]|uniref:hypothetical protein n=1 Tax=Streptomyces niveus TaxID=193462 RepID=UPI00369BC9AF
MTTTGTRARAPYGAALHVLSALTGQPERFFLGPPADSCRTRRARIEVTALLLLDLDDSDALTARRMTGRRTELLAVVDELIRAEEAAAGTGLDEELTGGWAA